MKFVLFLFSLLSLSAFASECFVVSGIKKDPKNFIKGDIFKAGASKVAGKDCTVVGSWRELRESITSKKIPKGADILIVQGAHGNQDENKKVTFACDAQDVSSSEVLNTLNKISSDYQVGAVIHSCYSGDMMRDKLLQDEIDSSNLDKLCLYTSSSMGRVALGNTGQDIISKLKVAKSGQTLENLFLETRAGTISSAAWSEIGLPEYLAKKTTEAGYKTLQALDQVTRGELSCASDLGAANAALCAAPGVTDAIFEDLSAFQDPFISSAERSQGVEEFAEKIKTAKEALKKNPASKLAKSEVACQEFLFKTYKDNLGEKFQNLKTWDVMEKVAPIIEQQSGYAACKNFIQLLPKERSEEAIGLAAGPFKGQVELFRYNVDKLQKRYSKRKMDDSFDIKDFAKAASGEKIVCKADDKQQIIQSMFGESFFLNETDLNGYPDEMIYDRNVSTQLALKSFQNASLMKKEMPFEKDQKRRAACRNFKF